MIKKNQNKKTILASLLSIAMVMLFTAFALAADEEYEQNEQKIEKKEPDFTLRPMTVIATKTAKSTLDSPASISIITEVDINAFNSEHPYTPLARTEGIWPRAWRGLADYWARPVIRGQRALILVDGANWYDYGYYTHTGAIPMSDVERIEVARGPFAALYGTLAQTGVINYITKIPQKTEIDASVSYGSWNSRFYSFRFADRPFRKEGIAGNAPWFKEKIGKRFFYSLSLKSRTSDGYVTTPTYKTLGDDNLVTGALDPDIEVVSGWRKDIDPQKGTSRCMIGDQGDNYYEDYGLFLKVGFDFSSQTSLWYSLNLSEFEYGWQDGKSFLKDSSDVTHYEGDVYIQDGSNTYSLTLSPFNFTSDPKAKKSLAHTLRFNHSIPNLVDIVGLACYNDKKSSTHYRSKSKYKVEYNYLAQADLAATFHLFNDISLITIGVQGIEEDLKIKNKALSDPYDKDSINYDMDETTGKSQTAGLFIQAEISPVDFLSAYIGGRYDHWWGKDISYSDIDGNSDKYSDTDEGQFSPKVSLVLRPLKNGSIRASYGEAFTAPSLYLRTETVYWEGGGTQTVTYPNPDLDPTKNKSWEVGTEWDFWRKRVRVKATYFENEFEDLIVKIKQEKDPLPDGTEYYEQKRINADKAEVNGIETSVEAILPFNLKGGVYYTHHWSEYIKTHSESTHKEGWEVSETPTDMWSFWLGYFGEYLDASISYRFCDSRNDEIRTQYSDNTFKADDDNHILDAKLTVRPVEHISIAVAVDNLLDEEYYVYYRAPGRYWLASMSVKF